MPVDNSGRFYVVGSVPLLHPEAQTVADMLEGWRNQQLCRNLAHDTIEQRIRLVERFLSYTNEFPWTWTPAMVEEFFSDLRSIQRRRHSTIRGYQNALRLFCSYVCNPDYGWDRVCEQRFGTHPAQVFFDWNTAPHVQDNEQSPEKRAFTKQELQEFFDYADDKVTLIAASARKGWLPAYRRRHSAAPIPPLLRRSGILARAGSALSAPFVCHLFDRRRLGPDVCAAPDGSRACQHDLALHLCVQRLPDSHTAPRSGRHH